eukprot:7479032-Prorocentrum_lima.AAC.1
MTSSLVGSEMCIRDRSKTSFLGWASNVSAPVPGSLADKCERAYVGLAFACLLYTSDAADDM